MTIATNAGDGRAGRLQGPGRKVLPFCRRTRSNRKTPHRRKNRPTVPRHRAFATHPEPMESGPINGRRRPSALIAVDAEQSIEIGRAEDLLDHRRHLAKPEFAPRVLDPALEQDQLAQQGARDQVDLGEIEHEADRCVVVGERRQDLVGDLAHRSLVEELAILKADHLDSVRITDLNPGSNGHRSHPRKKSAGLTGSTHALGGSSPVLSGRSSGYWSNPPRSA